MDIVRMRAGYSVGSLVLLILSCVVKAFLLRYLKFYTKQAFRPKCDVASRVLEAGQNCPASRILNV
jgi:hypothetical protein